MIIDAHTHIGFNGIINDRAPELIKSMNKAKIDLALVLAGDMNNCPTEKIISELSSYADRLLPVGTISPLAPKATPAQVEGWLKAKKIYGLKFYPGYEYFYPADPVLRPYLELLVKYNRPAIFHSGDTYSRVGKAKLKYAQAIHHDDLATEMPDLKIIIAHFGYPWQIDAGEVCYKNKNVYVDCSGFVYGKFGASHRAHFKKVINQFEEVAGTLDRVLFGTDWPIGDQKSYVETAKIIFGKNSKRLFSQNALELFGIHPAETRKSGLRG